MKKIILLFLETMEPKTWRTLYSILNVLDMEGVVEETESYLSSKCQWVGQYSSRHMRCGHAGAGLGEESFEVGHGFSQGEMVAGS